MFNDLIGKTYQQCGNCYGLCRIVCSRLGIDLPIWEEFCVDQAAEQIEKYKHFFEPVIDKPIPGDLVHIINFDGPPHVGVITEPNTIMHVTSGHRVHRMSINNQWIKSRIAGIYRYVAKS